MFRVVKSFMHQNHTFVVNSRARSSSAGLAKSSEDRKNIASAICTLVNKNTRGGGGGSIDIGPTSNKLNSPATFSYVTSWSWNESKIKHLSIPRQTERWKPTSSHPPTSASSARFLRYVAASISQPSSYNHSSCSVARFIASSLCSSVLTISRLASKSRRAARTCFNPPP